MSQPEGHPDLGRRLRRARRRGLFVGLRSLLRVVGFGQVRLIGRLTGLIQFHFARRQRRRIQQHMAHALGRSERETGPLLREAYQVNNAAVLEILAMFDRHQDEAMLAGRCEIDGLDRLRTAMAGGRGAILLATHAGNAALLTVKLARAGWAVSVVYREARMMSAGFVQEGLERYGIEGILANTGLRAYGQMLSALKQGRIVFIMMDQGVREAKDGLMERFLGKTVPMPTGPAQLARAARAPLLPVVTTAAWPQWKFRIDEPVAVGQETLESDVHRLVRLTERQILDFPQLWSWHQRRWRKPKLA
ncbi:lysophospholipid acyltransferase family protein [Xylophilus sp. GOD-11R]|uniref:lysophospholipid acyltransferase family protein n=1 Tax=Xylophilus sp. GOD-11R TaxID=3089814 RepID=UPI00298BD0E3|nr:lysophospholipid acyltransferase family protein [Xylophilus sp. GOD-11R]WPB58946.1 lysophospholipid acyltransferase family protein [Xylophilus sp. GOD-11R]